MSERDAFLRCILENPADDVARLVFADWLQEHGELHRAELTRAQVLWHSGVTTWTPAACIRTSEEREWFMNHLQPLGVVGWEFERGFIYRIHLPCAAFLQHAEAIFSRHPVTDVKLVDVVSAGAHGRFFHKWTPLHGTEIIEWLKNLPQNFDTEDEAHQLLSTLCVRLGRQRAKLPPLPTLTPAS